MQRKTELWIVGGFVVLALGIAIVAGIYSSFSSSATSSNSIYMDATVPALSSTDWSRGAVKGAVTVIEYGDFQCPACGAYEPIMQQLTQQFGDRVRFAFRNYPLPQHQDAQIAAQAAEAAGLQGKYWEMHDLLYAKQTEWSNEPAASVVSKFFNGYAQSLGLQVSKFDSDINSEAVKNKIGNDKKTANTAGIDHTPTFFINQREIVNPNGGQEFASALNAALASSTPTQ